MTTLLTSLTLTEQQRRALKATGADKVIVSSEPNDIELREADIWLGPGLTPELFGRAGNLKWIQATGAGIEAFLFPELVMSDVPLTNVRGMHADTVANHALALILAHSRSLPIYVRQQDRREWRAASCRELAGATLTVVGMGMIGGQIARLGRAFDMDVIGVRRSHASEVSSGVRQVSASSLREALAAADWAVVATPLTRETHHLIGREELSAMRSTAVIVNISRGAVVDQGALLEALRKGAIGGACLDVFEEEPLPSDSPLWQMPGVIITPHVAGVKSSFQERIVELFCDNLSRYLSGQPLRNVIDKVRGY